jgi:hypothetical protein
MFNNANSGIVTRGIVVTRSPSDDLESLFYIFIELISTYPKPGALPDHTRRRLPWHEDAILSNLYAIAWAKKGMLANDDDTLMTVFVMPYFHSLGPVVLAWRKLLNGADKEPKCWITHEQLKVVLDNGLESAHDEPRSLPPPPLPPTSTHLPTTSSGLQSQSAAPRRNPKRNRKGH